MKNKRFKIHVQRAIHRDSQQDLAHAIGVSRQTIHSIEAGKFTPGTNIALKIAQRYGTSVEEIFDEENK